MGAVAALKRAVAPAAVSPAERRSKRRYPISLDVHYKVLKHRRVERFGSGRTLNISSGGILFEADGVLPASGPIELALNWPFLLHGSCNLKLVIRGRIVRSEAKSVAVRAEFHEFRTTGPCTVLRDAEGRKASVRAITA